MRTLLIATSLLAGCQVEKIRPGDSWSRVIEWMESHPTEIRDGRDLGSEVWAEWRAPGCAAVWCRVAFSRGAYRDWITLRDRDGVWSAGPEPRVLWVYTDYGATGLRGPLD